LRDRVTERLRNTETERWRDREIVDRETECERTKKRKSVRERERGRDSTRYSTGWRRPIGCLKLQVFFRKRAINYWALLRKMN